MAEKGDAKGFKPTKEVKEEYPMNNYSYDMFLGFFSIIMDLFFREIHPRGSWKVPRQGPVIFVAAPHANQFVDPILLMRVLRYEAHRRVAVLTAAHSMKRKFIGWGSRLSGAVPVGRAQDLAKTATGKVYLPDPVNDPCLVRGIGTNFEGPEVQIGGLLIVPKPGGSAMNIEIAEVKGPEELRLKKPVKGTKYLKLLTGRDDIDENGQFQDENVKGAKEGFQGSPFKTAPKIDQSKVYEAVFARLNTGGAVGIFPEGGSHDRTEMLPLKAGVAIMALGAIADNPDCDVKIVPVGLNYFHAHKFRSRAVVEFGNPLDIPPELIELYKSGNRREAVSQLLDTVYQSLVAVTVTSPDYDTLMLIQAVRRLYNPTGKALPLPLVVELNRRLVKGYTHFQKEPRIVALKKSILDYNAQLRYMNLRDHQVEYARFSIPEVILTLFYRLAKIVVLSVGVIPGLVLFSPVFIAAKVISIRKSREALAASSVKLAARDVVATWKILIALAFAPILYTFYIFVLAYWTYTSRVGGRVPDWVPLWLIVGAGYVVFPAVTFAALRFGEVGMDILKSLRPLVLALDPTSSNTIHGLRRKREELAAEVTDSINTFGPQMFPDFDSVRLLKDPPHQRGAGGAARPRSYSDPDDDGDGDDGMTRSESYRNLGSVGFFASNPASRSRSRSRSPPGREQRGAKKPAAATATGREQKGGGGGSGSSLLSDKGGLEEVSQRIRSAMMERGAARRGQVALGEAKEVEDEDEDQDD